MRTLLWAAVLLALSPFSLAQTGATPPGGAKQSAKTETARETNEALRARINDRIKHMRKSIDDGLPITTNVQVTVWLRNKYRLRGVVKGGRFVEKVHGLDFVEADMQTPGAGLRVWYYDNTNSYIFLPFEGIARYKIGARLTEVQIKRIEERIEARRRSAEEKRRSALARLKARQAADGSEKEAAEEGAEKAETKEEKRAREKEENRLLALLSEYPPESGWGPEKIKEIERRKIAIGAFPDAKSKRFMAVFEEWMKAVQLKEEKAAAKQKNGNSGAGEGGTKK